MMFGCWSKKELAAANKKFPMFASAHEGWAVIREELQEVKDDHYMLEQYLENRLWNEVRYNNEIPKEDLKEGIRVFRFAGLGI